MTDEEPRKRADEPAPGPAFRAPEPDAHGTPGTARPRAPRLDRVADQRIATVLRGVLRDLTSLSAAPLPPLSRPRLLRRLPHFLVCVIAVALAFGATHDLKVNYQLGLPLAALTGFAQGAAMVLALRRPVPAWWLALCANALAAATARAHMGVDIPSPGPDWPWTTPAVAAQAVVLFLLALRVPMLVAVGALFGTALCTGVLEGLIGGQAYRATGLQTIVVLALVVFFGTAVRGRREARTQLVEQASLTEEERARRTLLEERSRIARELHDVVAHHMSVISIQAQVAPHLVENPSEELRENLAGIRQNALEALTELRRVLGVLRSENPDHPDDPYALAAPGTGAAPDAPQPTLDRLDALIENTRAAGLDVRGDVRGEVRPLAPGVELSAYRIVQEALSNALRHAPGSTVAVEVAHDPDGLRLIVTNSRPRQAAPPSPGAGHGLLGMRERAAMLGGHLTVTRTFQGGFAVVAFLPRDGVALPDGPEGPHGPDSPAAPGSPAPEIIFPTGDETP